MIDFEKIEGFDWDAGNARKNEKHGVTQAEAEQVFSMNRFCFLLMRNTANANQGITLTARRMRGAFCTLHLQHD